jgi:hypothetical protein
MTPQGIDRELPFEPAIAQRFERDIGADLVAERKQSTMVRAALKTGTLTPSMFRRSTPSFSLVFAPGTP